MGSMYFLRPIGQFGLTVLACLSPIFAQAESSLPKDPSTQKNYEYYLYGARNQDTFELRVCTENQPYESEGCEILEMSTSEVKSVLELHHRNEMTKRITTNLAIAGAGIGGLVLKETAVGGVTVFIAISGVPGGYLSRFAVSKRMTAAMILESLLDFEIVRLSAQTRESQQNVEENLEYNYAIAITDFEYRQFVAGFDQLWQDYETFKIEQAQGLIESAGVSP